MTTRDAPGGGAAGQEALETLQGPPFDLELFATIHRTTVTPLRESERHLGFQVGRVPRVVEARA